MRDYQTLYNYCLHIIVHPRGVVFPEGFSPRENNIPIVNNYDVHANAGNNCFIIPKLYLQ